MGAWIASGGLIKQVVVVPPPTIPQPSAPSNGESEVGASDAELPSPHQLIPKVRQVDDMEHTLDKGLWVGTGVTCHGWKIFVHVSFLSVLFASTELLILHVQDQLMAHVPTCQRCQTLRHKCYGFPDWVCGQCQCDKKTCQDVMVKGEPFFWFPGYLSS